MNRVQNAQEYQLAVRASRDVVMTPSQEMSNFGKFLPGEWDEDFHKYPHKSYTFSVLGRECKLCRHRGNWCGYVEVRKGEEGRFEHLDIHGDITGGTENMIGFDTAHCDDVAPTLKSIPEDVWEGVYWTLEMTRAETCWLACQIEALSKDSSRKRGGSELSSQERVRPRISPSEQ